LNLRIQAFLQQSPLFAVRRASRQVETHLARIIGSGEISFLEALVLVSVFFEEPQPVRPSELAGTLSTTRGNVSHCISSLEAKGLVRRRIDPEDARGFNVVLKPDGKSLAMRVIRALDRLQKDFEQRIRASELQTALAVIEKVGQMCAARPGSSRSLLKKPPAG